MQLLALAASVTEEQTSSAEWWQEPWRLLVGAVISGGVLLFIIQRSWGRSRPHKVTVADYWWTRRDGVMVTANDEFGPVDGYDTWVRFQVRGRRLAGERNVTNVSLCLKPPPWKVRRRWQRAAAPLDLAGDEMVKLRGEGLSLGDKDSNMIVASVVQNDHAGHFDLSGHFRLLPWAGELAGVPKRLNQITLSNSSIDDP
jgi:hypothetical protein